MLLEPGNRLRSQLFLGLILVWAGWQCLSAVPRVFWQEPGENLRALPQALNPDPRQLYLPLALSPEMVAIIREELPADGELLLFRRTDLAAQNIAAEEEALDRQVLRCSQFFFPLVVQGVGDTAAAGAAIAQRKPPLVMDYNQTVGEALFADYEIASELPQYRLWRRKSGS